MRYWDASALVPLCVEETRSTAFLALVREKPIVTWAMSMVEVASAIERRTRDGNLDIDGRERAMELLRELSLGWIEITSLDAVRDRALRILATHPLRAADALQLAAALFAAADRPAGNEFVCSDEKLRDAARREGFRVLPSYLRIGRYGFLSRGSTPAVKYGSSQPWPASGKASIDGR